MDEPTDVESPTLAPPSTARSASGDDRAAPSIVREFLRPRALAAYVLVPALLGGLILMQTRWFRLDKCETYDEFTYLRMGICIYRHGDFLSLASPMCPAMPILLEYAWPALSARHLPDTEGWEMEVPMLIRRARLSTSVVIGVPLVLLIYAWIARRRGWFTGAVGGGMAALSPTVLAAASIATTDACFALFALVALAALHRYQVRPSRRTLVLSGVGMGLAMGSKQTAVFLFPVALLELLLKSPERRPTATRTDHVLLILFRTGTRLAALIVLTFTVDWALYGFGLGPTFGKGNLHAPLPVIVPMVANLFPNSEAIMVIVRKMGPPLALDTFMGQIDHATHGHAAFLMGRHSQTGWWYFFPVAIALKSTPAELVLMGLVIALACRPRSWIDPARRLWLGSIAVMLGLGMASSLNIGHRYMLLVYPLTFLLAADWLGALRVRRPIGATVLGVSILTWQGISAFGIAPHYLSYFNNFCGGPMEGYRYLVDSSLDWGQDLPELRRELEARRYHKVALCYFGTGRPFAYGVRSMNWMDIQDPIAEGCDWLAISATALQEAYSGSSDLIRRFGPLPSARAGYTIFLYDLKDPRVREALEAIRRPLGYGGPGHPDRTGPGPADDQDSNRNSTIEKSSANSSRPLRERT